MYVLVDAIISLACLQSCWLRCVLTPDLPYLSRLYAAVLSNTLKVICNCVLTRHTYHIMTSRKTYIMFSN